MSSPSTSPPVYTNALAAGRASVSTVLTAVMDAVDSKQWASASPLAIQQMRRAFSSMSEFNELNQLASQSRKLYISTMRRSLQFPIRNKEGFTQELRAVLAAYDAFDKLVVADQVVLPDVLLPTSEFSQRHATLVQLVTLDRATVIQNVLGCKGFVHRDSYPNTFPYQIGLGATDVEHLTLEAIVDKYLVDLPGQVRHHTCTEPCAETPCNLLVSKLYELPSKNHFLEVIFEVCPTSGGGLSSVIYEKCVQADGTVKQVLVGYGITAALFDITLGELKFKGPFLDLYESFKSVTFTVAYVRHHWDKLSARLSADNPPYFDHSESLRRR